MKQIFVRPKTVGYNTLAYVKMSQQMFRVAAIRFHTATQTFSRLIKCVVDGRLLHTGPRSNQTNVRYTNK